MCNDAINFLNDYCVEQVNACDNGTDKGLDTPANDVAGTNINYLDGASTRDSDARGNHVTSINDVDVSMDVRCDDTGPCADLDISVIADRVSNDVISDRNSGDVMSEMNPNNIISNSNVFNSTESILKSLRESYQNNVIIGHINVNSLRNKFTEVENLLMKSRFEILALSETKLDCSDKDACFSVKNYSLYRQDKRSNSGGLVIYVKNNIPSTLGPMNLCTDELEYLSVEISCKGNKILVMNMYKNPKMTSKSFENKFKEMAESVLSKYENVIIIGDLNFNMLQNNTLSSICPTINLTNVIKEPTCFKSNTPSLIDVMLVSKRRKIVKSFSIDTGISDFHNLIGGVLRIHAPPPPKKVVFYRKIASIDYEVMKEDITDSGFDISNEENVDTAFDKLQNLLKSMVDKHAPKKKKVVRLADFHCMSRRLRKAILVRNQSRNRFFKNRSKHNLAIYRKHRNSVTIIKREETRQYFREKCQGGTSNKDFWKAIKPFFSNTKTKSDSIPLREGNEIITKNEEVCEIFNEFFIQIGSEIGTSENNNRPCQDIISEYSEHESIKTIKNRIKNSQNFTFTPVTERDVIRVIRSLSSKKAAGYDEIPIKIIKMVCFEIAKPMMQITNQCIRQQRFPEGMKKANITPLYKKKDKLCKENYRSVNLLVALSKILEKLLYNQIYKYMEPLFHNYLSGFRQGYGCHDVLIKMTEDWRKSLDSNEMVGIVAIDLSKAFDCMSHGLLLAKADAYGFSLGACNLLKSYLIGRLQRVKVADTFSDWVTNKKGVPQGSILGPLLFNIFINDLLYLNFHSNVYNYADDNTLSFSGNDCTTVKKKIGEDCLNAMKWFSTNYMKANAEKFQLMFLNRHGGDETHSLNLGDCVIESSNAITVLGLDIDNKLNFNGHIDDLCSKASKQVNSLKRMKHLLDKNCKCIIYNSFVSSNFNYSPLAWMFSSKSNFEKLEQTNIRALRFVTNNDAMQYDEICRQEKQLNVEKRCIKAVAVQMFKIKKQSSPTYLQSMFTERELTYDMRDDNLFNIPKFRTVQYGKRSFRYYGAKLWSMLPNNMKGIASLKGFKTAVTKWLLDKNDLQRVHFL